MSRRSRSATNTILLTGTNTLNRLIGFAYRIALVRVAGQEAVGLFQMVFPVYSLFLVLATAGLPIAVSKLVAESEARGSKSGSTDVLRAASGTAALLGLAATWLLLLCARPLSESIIQDSRLQLALMIIAPSLPIVALGAVFRGYFQGLQEIRVVAASQLLEQISHIGTTLCLATLVVGKGPVQLTATLAAGSILGEFVGLGTYLVCYPFCRTKPSRSRWHPPKGVLKHLYQVAIPTTTTRLVQSVAQLMQSILIPIRLRLAGLTASQTAIALGQLSGMALNLLFIPALFTASLAITLLPQMAISKTRTPEQTSSIFLRALNWTVSLSLPISMLFITLGEPICQLLFDSRVAGSLLRILALGGPLLYVQQISAATLQGLGKPGQPLIASLIGTAISVSLIHSLTPLWQIQGAAIGLLTGFVTSGLLSLFMVAQQVNFLGQWFPQLVKLLAATLIAGYITDSVHLHCLANLGQSTTALLVASIAGLLAYLCCGKLARAL